MKTFIQIKINFLKLCFVIVFSTISCIKTYAQKFEDIFLANDFVLYKNTKVKLKQDLIGVNFSHNFYCDLKDLQKDYDNKVLYPSAAYNFQTEKDSLKNRVFIIENIIGKDGKTFNTENSGYFDSPIFILKDEVKAQTIYYKYDKKFEHNFPFLVADINYPVDFFCSQLSENDDDFTNEKTIRTPMTEGNNLAPASLTKVSKKGRPSAYYLSLRAYGNTVNVNERGIILIFEDNTKWIKNAEIDVEADKDSYEYSVFITLSQNDLKLFSSKRIKKFRLYIYDATLNAGFASKFLNYTKCLLKR
ncbi:hypothetical protein [Chryseobacterium sp.]|uniref:hypothetical protein n=1 Tax=Chryseobacterium sp. TaxID=1871047 RepID=UPI0028A02C0B|nr:hypothetical protein [Chryseobacterium sp.]